MNSSMWNIHDDLKGKSLGQLKDIQRQDSLPYAICAINVDGDLNIGNMIRTACIMGAEKFFILGKRRYDKRSAVGSYNYLDIEFLKEDAITDNISIHQSLCRYGYYPVIIEQGGSSITNFYFGKKHGLKPCFVFGNESHGIPSSIMVNNCVVSISQKGVLRSLNVSNTASIVCHHAMLNLSE